MIVKELVWDDDSEFHILRHNVTGPEAEQAAYGSRFTFRSRGNSLYVVLGRTEGGRYLTVIVRDLGQGIARLVTARDMTRTERRRYLRHAAH